MAEPRLLTSLKEDAVEESLDCMLARPLRYETLSIEGTGRRTAEWSYTW